MFKTLLGVRNKTKTIANGPKEAVASLNIQSPDCSSKISEASQDNSSRTSEDSATCLKESNTEQKPEEETLQQDVASNTVSSSTFSDFVQEISQDLKRQEITLEDLLEGLSPFALEWKSVRDVAQCSSCVVPIDFLSRKVRLSSVDFLNFLGQH